MNHRQHQEALAAKRGQSAPLDDDLMQLLECINSDQVSASQLVQHYEAGEIQTNQGASDGRNTEN